MYKKILFVLLACISMSFATWDYFPLHQSGAEVKAGFSTDIKELDSGDDDESDYLSGGILISARYVFGNSLELSLQNWGMQIFDDLSDASGLYKPVFGARYQLSRKTSVFFESTLPLGSDDVMAGFMYAGLQRAFVLSKHFAWGNEIGYQNFYTTEVSNDIEVDNASIIRLSSEIDFNFKPRFIFFIGYNFMLNINETEIESDYDSYSEGDDFDGALRVFAGAHFKISNHLAIEAEYKMQPIGWSSYDYTYLQMIFSAKYSF